VNRDDGRLDILYDHSAIREVLSQAELLRRSKGVWKYRELLPEVDPRNVVSLGEGGAPLLPAKKMGRKLGLEKLWLLDDARNPTSSFKDRAMTVGISKAIDLGYKTVVSASSGNAAASLSAYAAKAGLNCISFVPEIASSGKLTQLMIFGAMVARVREHRSGEDPTVKMLKEACDHHNWYPCPSFGPMNPYQAEGSKTMSYDIVEALGWKAPDWVFAPVGAGGCLAGNWKGYLDYEELGFAKALPRMVAVQPEGCSPLVRAFEQGVDPLEIMACDKPNSVATGLMDPFPWDGDAALKAIRQSHGLAVSVSDDEILDAQKLVAKNEGIFAEPSGATSLAGLVRLLGDGSVERSDEIVVEITGSGLKDPDSASTRSAQPPLIDPCIEDVERVFRSYLFLRVG
jgi:threonine synthase